MPYYNFFLTLKYNRHNIYIQCDLVNLKLKGPAKNSLKLKSMNFNNTRIKNQSIYYLKQFKIYYLCVYIKPKFLAIKDLVFNPF